MAHTCGYGGSQSDTEALGHAGAQTIAGMMLLQGGDEGGGKYWLHRAATQEDATAGLSLHHPSSGIFRTRRASWTHLWGPLSTQPPCYPVKLDNHTPTSVPL